MSKHWSYYANIGGLGSQAEADRKKAALEERRAGTLNEEERAKQELHRRKVEGLLERQLLEIVRSNETAFRQEELLKRLLNEMQGEGRKAGKGKAVKIEWQTRMSEQEKLDREALWIPLTDVVVTKAMVESQYKMLVKSVHPDLNPGIGDGPFIALRAARDRMIKRVAA